MNDKTKYPMPHTWAFTAVLAGCAILLMVLLAACSTTQTVTVKVPVQIECREAVPDRPAMPTDGFAEKPALDAYVRAARAEIQRREGYEIQLRTALEACTAPIKAE